MTLISADLKVLVPNRELSYHETQQISTELKAKGSPSAIHAFDTLCQQVKK